MLQSKKQFIVFLSVTVLLSGCGAKPSEQKQQVNDKVVSVYTTPIPYAKDDLVKQYPDRFDAKGNIVYPLQPGSKEYEKRCKEIGNDKLLEEVNMPKDLTERLDTKSLLQAVENHPFFWEMRVYENFETALDHVSKKIYEMEVLLKREDAPRAAYDTYTQRKVKANDDPEELGIPYYTILLEQYLLLQDHGYRSLTEEERKQVRIALEKNQSEEQKMEQQHAPYVDSEEAASNLDLILQKGGDLWPEYLGK